MSLNRSRSFTHQFSDRRTQISRSSHGRSVYYKGDLEALNILDNLSCHRTNMALRVICSDDLGKEAVQEGLKTIKLKNVPNKADMQITFGGGVLEMHLAYALRSDGMYSDNEIRAVLEKGL